MMDSTEMICANIRTGLRRNYTETQKLYGDFLELHRKPPHFGGKIHGSDGFQFQIPLQPIYGFDLWLKMSAPVWQCALNTDETKSQVGNPCCFEGGNRCCFDFVT